MVQLIHKLWLILTAAALLVWVLPLPRSTWPAFIAGELLFGVNLVVLVFAGQWLLAAAPGVRGESPRATWVLFLALTVKIFLLGVGAYLALITLALRVDFFVGGLATALAVLALLLYLDGGEKKTTVGVSN